MSDPRVPILIQNHHKAIEVNLKKQSDIALIVEPLGKHASIGLLTQSPVFEDKENKVVDRSLW